jgi:multisubunit Na+/H+ antiporter MnhB subunit
MSDFKNDCGRAARHEISSSYVKKKQTLHSDEKGISFYIHKKNRYANDIFIAASILLCIILNSLAWFLCGLFFPKGGLFLPFIIIPVALILIITLCIRAIIRWPKQVYKKSKVIKIWIALLLYLIVCLLLWQPGYKPFTYGFREHIRDRVDVSGIRKWLESQGNKNLYYEKTDESLLPEVIRIHNPSYVDIEVSEHGKPQVRMIWGGVFAHWGVVIMTQNYNMPNKKENEYILPFASGAYVWHEIQ